VIEQAVYDRLKTLCSGRVYPDIAPAGAVEPYITYQQIGGEAVSFVGLELPSKRNARVMLKAWATTRMGAANLASEIEELMLTSTVLQASPIGSFSSEYDKDTGTYGSRQDFSCWIDR
jgi:hypothetical protein